MAINVNMFRCPVTIERQPRLKNGRPAHSTTGVDSINCIQRDESPITKLLWSTEGTICAIARKKTGMVKTSPNQKRRVMSVSSGFSPSSAETVCGSSAIPHLGQSPGPSCSTSGCIGHVYAPLPGTDAGRGLTPVYDSGAASNFSLQRVEQK